MESAISQQGLETLLASLRSSISTEKVLSILGKLKLDATERSALYHGILEILNENNGNSKAAALAILEGIEQVFVAKMEEALLQAQDGMANEDVGASGPGKQSPIFRRVG
ncbi:MAG TPA: hypothetical protein VI423_01770 [Paenisporosarcina sp.]|nr:hypothetical protein [Paenisporosarcina sp.]